MSLSRREFVAGTATAALIAACQGTQHPPKTAETVPSTASPQAPTKPVSSDGLARFVQAGPRDSNLVALTFHGSGNPKLTLGLLTIAQRLKTVMTVFAVGQWLEQYPDIAHRILAGGHELANHTYTHPTLGTLGPREVAEEIRRCRDVIVSQTGNNGSYFRPSGMDKPTSLILKEAHAAGYPVVVGFDVDPHDYTDPGTSAVISRVEKNIHPGSIVSLHLGHVGTVKAFEPIVNLIRTKALEPTLLRNLIT